MKLHKMLKQMRKAAAIMTSAALIASCMLTAPLRVTAAAFSTCTGSGSSGDPYIITTADQLAELSTEVYNGTDFSGDYFELGKDIILSGSWEPIGYYVYGVQFAGTFDGKGFTISNLTIGSDSGYDGSYSHAGLFGQVASSATIKNLNVSVNIYSSVSSSDVGALAGYSAGKIINCTSSGTVSAPGSCVGGMVGYAAGGSIIGCSSIKTDISNEYIN